VQNCQWGENLITATTLCKAMQITTPTPGYIEFPVGSMFWAQSKALKPLLEKSFAIQDFEEELGQTDRTIMHAIERLISHTALAQGYSIALLENPHKSYYYP
jgi:lipopolysaccharide biosynthesis protein